jgi:hypothetical protein
VVILTLAGTCAFATFYEMEHGTAAAQRDIYRTPGFSFLLGLLGVNIFSVMISRWPWKKHHIGFVLAHIGILILLAGSLISLHTGLDSNMALFEGESTDRVTLLDKALFLSLPGPGGQGARFPAEFERRPPRTDAEQRFPVPGSGVTLVAEGYAPHVQVSETFEAGGEGHPALHAILQAPFATQDAWLLADDSSRSRLDLGPVSLDFRRAASEAEARQLLRAGEGKGHLSFVLVPRGRILYRASGPTGPGVVEVGKPLATQSLGMAVTVDRFLEAAVERRSVAPAPLPAKEERQMPAVRVRLEGAGERTAPEWILWTERRTIPFAGGQASVAYRSPELEVPFRVTLLKFNSDKYPGSNMPATYESWVRVDDAERGTSEHHISMNNPLHYRGYIFFQASFVEGTPMMSIFSVARAPGLPLVYLGVALIASGVAWMFYLKPYLARRQALRANEAHQRRESRNEAPAADPVAGRSGPAQPARSGA